MIILNCNNISLSFGERKILDEITFNIHDTDKIGIVGVNGAGKTTLLKVLIPEYIHYFFYILKKQNPFGINSNGFCFSSYKFNFDSFSFAVFHIYVIYYFF
jgi:ABC-type arginine transport system ATPase subunit